MHNTFLTNYSNITFLNKIKISLSKCKYFLFSVSFIKIAGLTLIINDIINALERGAKGKIICSTYQNFTDIASLENLLSLTKQYPNFECHLDFNCFGENGFHSKGYIFEYLDDYEIVIGSSNITRFALLKNIEWNLALSTRNKEESISDALLEFNLLWGKTYILSKDLIKEYLLSLEYAIEKWDMDYIHNFTIIKPNYMQKKALKEIRRYRDLGINRALIIAATGSGKTYLAAFDARNFESKKLLFIVHRDTILSDALNTFKTVFGDKVSYGRFTGEYKELESDFLFSTNITMKNNLQLFDKNEFDYIVIDEVHHATASTYKNIIDYFSPQFLLGLTATPERTDNESVFELFEKNVPFELRLRDALLNDLVSPFKYYGIRDKLVDYDEDDIRKLSKQLSSIEHCEFIIKEIEQRRKENFKDKSLDKLKAIGFCRTKEHARQMSETMDLLGYNTTYLTGENNTGERLKAFKDLQDEDNPLQIIFAIDILNEGVDIPRINMVLFLRPTESSIIFIQQLGRGLRKCEGKDNLIVLDFIGNSYRRSVQIALALGTLSNTSIIEKPLLKDLVSDNFKSLNLPGTEIYIDELSKEEILNYIERTNFNNYEFLKQDYENFKKYLKTDQYPSHMDFLNNDCAPNLLRFINSRIKNSKNSSYYNFLVKIDEKELPLFNEEQVSFINYLSCYLPLVRPYEFLIIEQLIIDEYTLNELLIKIKQKIEIFKGIQFEHALKNLQNYFSSEADKKNKPQYVKLEGGKYILNVDLSNNAFLDHVIDILKYGIERYNIEFGEFYGDFKLYSNYTTEQFMMTLCENSLIYFRGTKINETTVYILVNLKKDDKKEERLKYKDKFLDKKTFQWESQTGTTLYNKHGMDLTYSKEAHVFIRKVAEEDGIIMPYTYIGKGKLTKPRVSDNPGKCLLFDIILEKEIPDYLEYEFIVHDNK